MLHAAYALVGFLALLSVGLCAAPMAYFTGGVMTMLETGSSETDVGANYSLTPRDAIGLRFTTMTSQRPISSHSHGGVVFAGRPKHESAELNYTRLIQRWNTEDAQINVWALGGIGAMRGNTFVGEQLFYSPGAQIDAETTRFYFSAKGQLHRSKGIKNDFGIVRAGFSFWEAEYEETQPWFILEAKRAREFSEKIEITPMLRLINKNYFAELGVNQDKKVKVGLMLIFSRN